jgi:hypothetical protein
MRTVSGNVQSTLKCRSPSHPHDTFWLSQPPVSRVSGARNTDHGYRSPNQGTKRSLLAAVDAE